MQGLSNTSVIPTTFSLVLAADQGDSIVVGSVVDVDIHLMIFFDFLLTFPAQLDSRCCQMPE
jgi:hypothetical protein